MIFIISKKFALSIALIVFISLSITFAQANSERGIADSETTISAEINTKVIDYINKNEGTLSLDDQVYRLKLNAKVYDVRKNLVNRYALKKGQRVFVEVSGDRSERYIDSIFILGK